MNLLSLKKLFRSRSAATVHPPSSTLAFTAVSSPDPRPSPFLASAYQQLPWVYRAINVLAEQVASIPFLFSSGERGREHLITSGPLHDFYNQPHPLISRFQYWELRVIWLMLRGECIRIPIYHHSPHSSAYPISSAKYPASSDEHRVSSIQQRPSYPSPSASFAPLRFNPVPHHS